MICENILVNTIKFTICFLLLEIKVNLGIRADAVCSGDSGFFRFVAKTKISFVAQTRRCRHSSAHPHVFRGDD
jgi:hypothetical protein